LFQNIYLLQAQTTIQNELDKRLPTFNELVKYYGPYLGLVLTLIIIILVLQFFWFYRILKAKDSEIERLVAREKELNDRLLHMINEEIGYKKRSK